MSAAPPDEDAIKRRHLGAFESLASDLSVTDRNWILRHVAETGIALTDPGWLPAALASRLILDLRRAVATLEERITTNIDRIAETTTNLSVRVTHLDETLVNERANRDSRLAQEIAIIDKTLSNSVSRAGDALAKTLASAIERFDHALKTGAEAYGAAAGSAFLRALWANGRVVAAGALLAVMLGVAIGWFTAKAMQAGSPQLVSPTQRAKHHR